MEQVAVTGGLRLSNNNIAGCNSVRTSTACESCPVQVPETQVQLGEGPVNGGGNTDPLKVA